MKLLKKSTAIFMVLLTLFTMVPLSVFAARENYTTDTESKVDYKATNALGEVLSDAMTEEREEQNEGYFILDITVEDSIAKVDYSAPDDSQLIVAIYNEEGTKMITSAKADVDSSSEQTEVIFDEALPEYFLVKAFILDSENKPVCRSFESIKYTQDFQEFLAKTTDDFEEEQVINLDESTQNNFAVVSDDAQIIEQTESENILTTNDYENGIYVFENANSDITDLEEGDVLYFVYGEGAEDYILTKVGTIEADGTTVTITAADEYEMSDFFSYIKIDTEAAESEADEPSEYNLKRGSFDDESGEMDETEVSHSVSFSKTFDEDDAKVVLAGKLGIKLSLKFYYDVNLGEDYYEITQTNTFSITGSITVEASGSSSFEPLVIFNGGVPIFTGIEAEVEVKIAVEVKAELSATGTVAWKSVTGSRKISGKETEDLTKPSSWDFSFDASGKISISVTPSVTVGIKIVKVIQVKLSLGITASAEGELKLIHIDEGSFAEMPSEKHDCKKCINGDVSLSLNGDIKVTFGLKQDKVREIIKINLFTVSKKLYDFYISVERNDGEGGIEFGKGSCPHKLYLVTYNVVDEDNEPLSGVSITDEKHSLVTDSDGKAREYYKEGSYSYTVSLKNYVIDSSRQWGSLYFPVTGSARTVNVYMKEADKCTVRGTVTDEETGDTLSGVIVDFRNTETGEFIAAQTNSYGEYEIELLWGDYEISCSAADYEPCKSSLSLLTETLNYNISLEKEQTARVYGTVTDKETGDTLSGATITFTDSETGDIFTATTNSSGYYTAEVPYGSYTVAFSCDKYETSTTTAVINSDFVEMNEGLESKNVTASGNCGDNVTWVLYDTGELVINGEGDMSNYDYYPIPWYSERYSVRKVTIENGITSIGNICFKGCKFLLDVDIPDSVTIIGDGAFAGCSLTSIIIPDSVEKIGDGAFSGCSFDSIIIPDSVTSIGKSAFYACDFLESVTIGNGVTSISEDTFSWCDSLTNITFGDSITTIESYAFHHCESLTSITIPNSVITIGYAAFIGCYGLTSITVGDNVTIIKGATFASCDSLINVIIPKSVTTIDDSAFSGCTSLTDVYFTGSEAEWKKIYVGKYNEPLTSATIHYNYTPAAPTLLSAPRYLTSPSSLLTETVDTTPGHTYLMAVVRDDAAEDVLSDDNLLYIDQKEADSDTLTFSFELDEGVTDYDVLVYSADLNPVVPDEPTEEETTEAPGEEETTEGESTTEAEVTTTEAEETTAESPIETTTAKVEESTTAPTTHKEEPTSKPTTTKKEETTKSPSTTKPTTTKKAETTTTAPVTTTAPTTATTEDEAPAVKVKKPAKVKIKKPVSKKKKQIVVTWKAVKNVNGYQVAYSTSKKFVKKASKTKLIKMAKTIKTTLKKLKSGKKYFIRVRAYKTVEGKKVYGAYSKVKSIKVK